MRTGILILHRKLDSERKCICGSDMILPTNGGWACKRQARLKEPFSITVKLPKNKICEIKIIE